MSLSSRVWRFSRLERSIENYWCYSVKNCWGSWCYLMKYWDLPGWVLSLNCHSNLLWLIVCGSSSRRSTMKTSGSEVPSYSMQARHQSLLSWPIQREVGSLRCLLSFDWLTQQSLDASSPWASSSQTLCSCGVSDFWRLLLTVPCTDSIYRGCGIE